MRIAGGQLLVQGTDLSGHDTCGGVWAVCSNYHALFCTSTSHFLISDSIQSRVLSGLSH